MNTQLRSLRMCTGGARPGIATAFKNGIQYLIFTYIKKAPDEFTHFRIYIFLRKKIKRDSRE